MISFIATLTVGLSGIMLFFGLMQEKMIFHPQPVDPQASEQLAPLAFELPVIDSESKDAITLRGWLQLDNPSTSHPLIIYYGGNGEEVSWNAWLFENLATKSFLLVNYRGFGDSDGKPGEQALYSDALAIYDHIVERHQVDPAHIVLMGRSLGSGVATWVARQRSVSKLVLVTPFDSLTEVAKKHVPWLPVNWLLKHRFESIERAPQIKQPALAILAGRDEVVPAEHGRRLMAAWGGPHQIETIDNAGHNDISNFPEYWQYLNDFISER